MMNIVKILAIIGLIGLVSCDNYPKAFNNTATKTVICNKPDKCIDFFSVDMYGDFKSLLDSLEKKKIIKVERDSTDFAVVDFCGIEWGFNAHYKWHDDSYVVAGIYMLTDDYSEEVIDTTYKRLFDYYGEPYVYDTCEETSIWYKSNYSVVSRYLHVEEGGRTIYFYLEKD